MKLSELETQTPTLVTKNTLTNRNVAEDYLARTKGTGAVVSSPDLKAERKDLTQKEMIQASIDKRLNEAEKQFKEQDSTIEQKRSEIKIQIQTSRHKVAEVEARIQELNNTWNIFRHLTDEKDGLKKWVSREREMLEAHETNLKVFEKEAEKLAIAKNDYLKGLREPALIELGKSSVANLNEINNQFYILKFFDTANREAQDRYNKRAEEKAKNPFEAFCDSAYDSWSKSKAGKLVMGLATAVQVVENKIAGAINSAFDALTDKENWGKIFDKVGSVAGKIADTCAKGFNWCCKMENWLSLFSTIGNGLKSACTYVGNGIKSGVISATEFSINFGKGLLELGQMAAAYLTDPQNLKQLLIGGFKLAVNLIVDPKQAFTDIYNHSMALGSIVCEKLGVSKVFNLVKSGIELAGKGISASIDFVTNPESWKNLAIGICKACVKFVNGTAEIISAGLKFISDPQNLLNLFTDGVKLVGLLLTDPVAAFDKICSGINKLGNFVSDKLGLRAVWEGYKTVLGFIKSLSDTFGITDVISGLANLATLPFKMLQLGFNAATSFVSLMTDLVNGKISIEDFAKAFGQQLSELSGSVKERCKAVGKIVTGVAHFALECTGLADLGRGIGYAMVGDWKMAGMHFGLAAADLTFVALAIVSGGAGVVMIAGVNALRKGAIKNALQHAGKAMLIIGGQVGNDVAEEVAEKIGMTTLKAQAEVVAEKLYKDMAEKALSLDTIAAAARTQAKDVFKETLKEELDKSVQKILLKRLEDIVDNPKAFKEQLISLLGKKEGTKAFKHSLDMLNSGKHFDDLAKPLSDVISTRVYEKILPELEKSFASRFKQLLLSDADPRIARRLADEAADKGISKAKLIDDYVDEAAKGFKKGLKDAIDEIVEAAVKKALKKFKARLNNSSHLMSDSPDSKQTREVKTLKAPESVSKNQDKKTEVASRVSETKAKSEGQGSNTHTPLFRKRVLNVGTHQVVLKEELLPDDKWKVVGQEEIRAVEEIKKQMAPENIIDFVAKSSKKDAA